MYVGGENIGVIILYLLRLGLLLFETCMLSFTRAPVLGQIFLQCNSKWLPYGNRWLTLDQPAAEAEAK